MNNVSEEGMVHANVDTSGRLAAACSMHAEDLARQWERGVKNARAAVEDKIEDTKREAQRFVKRSRFAVEDKILESAHQMKKHPGVTLAAAFAAGAVLGFMMPRFGRR
ncbi:MAG: hypothetical protein ABL967_07705 [Bryobacteraceae bacterium]